SCSTIRSASGWGERPEETVSRFCGPRSIQWPGSVCVTISGASNPGRTSSGVALTGCIPLLVLLAWTGDPQCVCGDILRYHRPGCNPCSVPDLDRRHEAIVDAGPDVAADLRAALRLAGPVREVRRDRARADVCVGADFGVADVGQMRHFAPVADA